MQFDPSFMALVVSALALVVPAGALTPAPGMSPGFALLPLPLALGPPPPRHQLMQSGCGETVRCSMTTSCSKTTGTAVTRSRQRMFESLWSPIATAPDGIREETRRGTGGRQGNGGGGCVVVASTRRLLPSSSISSRQRRSDLFGAGGDFGYDGGESNTQRGDADGGDLEQHDPDESGSLAEEKDVDRRHDTADGDVVGSGDDYASPPAVSFVAPEVEKIRPTAVVGDKSDIGTNEDTSAWLPRLFPPSSDQDDDEDGPVVKPLVELPVDGVLLQLFPALLIGVLGLFLTLAVQMEASRFDGMVGENGGSVVVTDLREIRKTQQ